MAKKLTADALRKLTSQAEEFDMQVGAAQLDLQEPIPADKLLEYARTFSKAAQRCADFCTRLLNHAENQKDREEIKELRKRR